MDKKGRTKKDYNRRGTPYVIVLLGLGEIKKQPPDNRETVIFALAYKAFTLAARLDFLRAAVFL